LINQIGCFGKTAARNEFPVVDLGSVAFFNHFQLFRQRLFKVSLSAPFSCFHALRISELLEQAKDKGLPISRTAQADDFRQLTVTKAVFLLQVALSHKDRQWVLLALSLEVLGNGRFDELSAKVEGSAFVFLGWLLGYIGGFLQFLEKIGAEGGFEFAEKTWLLEGVVEFLPEEHGVGDFRHLF
jgi:hypothetical protein